MIRTSLCYLNIDEMPIEHPLIPRHLWLESSVIADEVRRDLVEFLVDESHLGCLWAISKSRQRHPQRSHIGQFHFYLVVVVSSLLMPKGLFKRHLLDLSYVLTHWLEVFVQLEEILLLISFARLSVTNFRSISRSNFIEHKPVNDLLANLDFSLWLQNLSELIGCDNFADDGDWADDVDFHLLDHHFHHQFTLLDALSIIEDRYQSVMIRKLILIILLAIINLLATGIIGLGSHVPLISFISISLLVVGLPCLPFLAIPQAA